MVMLRRFPDPGQSKILAHLLLSATITTKGLPMCILRMAFQ